MYIKAFFILYTQPAAKKDLKARETGSSSSRKRRGVKVWIVKLLQSKGRQDRLLSSFIKKNVFLFKELPKMPEL